jgi:hypothetical protein
MQNAHDAVVATVEPLLQGWLTMSHDGTVNSHTPLGMLLTVVQRLTPRKTVNSGCGVCRR